LARGAGLVVKVTWKDEIKDMLVLKRVVKVEYPHGKVFFLLSQGVNERCP
jgi:hypothetical protein